MKKIVYVIGSLSLLYFASRSFAMGPEGGTDFATIDDLPPRTTLVDVIEQHPDLSLFLKITDKTTLDELMEGSGPFTIFVPTNQAFEKLGQARINELINTPQITTNIIKHHMVNGRYSLEKLKHTASIPCLFGKSLSFSTKDNQIYINDVAKIVSPALKAFNGIVYKVDNIIPNHE